MATTMNVAIAATANAPDGPRLTISSTAASLCSPRCSSVISVTSSFRKHFAKLVGRCGRHGGAAFSPRDSYVGDDRRGFIIVQDMREGGHSVGPRVFFRAGRVTAIEHHADR